LIYYHLLKTMMYKEGILQYSAYYKAKSECTRYLIKIS